MNSSCRLSYNWFVINIKYIVYISVGAGGFDSTQTAGATVPGEKKAEVRGFKTEFFMLV